MSAHQREDIVTRNLISPETEVDRLKRDIYRSDMEKFLLFTQMLRANKIYSKAKITHK